MLAQSRMYGLPDGVYYCQQERTQQLNNRIAHRNIPSGPLEPQFSPRPVPTKYTLLPILDEKKPSSVPLQSFPTYNPHFTFNPGTAEAPWSGFATNINKESALRSQYFALQSCPQKEYVPSSHSELYNLNVPAPMEHPLYPELYIPEDFAPFNPNSYHLGRNVLNNFTRNQLKDVCARE